MNIDAPPRDDAWCIVDEKKYECTCGRTREKREASECYQHPCEWVQCEMLKKSLFFYRKNGVAWKGRRSGGWPTKYIGRQRCAPGGGGPPQDGGTGEVKRSAA